MRQQIIAALAILLGGIAAQAEARFVSPDPVPADTTLGTNFNRYYYANNNPYRFVDPDGRWVCNSSATNCGNFERAKDRADRASRSERLAKSEQSLVQQSVAQYGEKDDPSVEVVFREESSLIKGGAGFRADGGRRIELNAKRGPDDLAIDVVHEGSHGDDDAQRGRPLNSRAEREATEVKAYTAQAYFQKAEQISRKLSDGWTQAGGLNFGNIEIQAAGSVMSACAGETQGSCK